MWCSTTTTSAEPAGRGKGEADTVAALDARIGDRDRTRTADLLARAAGTGHLDLDQLDERMAGVWTARTGADLMVLEADLPPSLRAERDRQESAERQRAAARAGLRGHLITYLAVMALLVAVWVAAGMTSGQWYPWPVWPALGWGMAVAGQVRAARGAVR